LNLSDADSGWLADRILAASDSCSSIPPLTESRPDIDLSDAYRVAAAVVRRRIARGERPVGWKVGFTNTTIWDEYGVHAPIWGPMYDSTVATSDPESGSCDCPVSRLLEPRIEPEIAFRIGALPRPNMDDEELLSCVDAVGHGFEIVQSVFPGWRFRAADTVAAFALHGCYRLGPLVTLAPETRSEWRKNLQRFEITLFRNGVEMDRGVAGNVLGGGPLVALRHLVEGLPRYSPEWAITPGDIVTTGTVTRAFPVNAGERWSTRIDGIPLIGIDVKLV